MFVDRALRSTFRNFVTLFFVAACLTVPLHVGKSFLFRRVESVRNLHGDIEAFPGGRQVRSVGRVQLAQARRAALVVTAIEIVLIPILAGAARQVVDRDRGGGVPTVADAWVHCLPPILPGPRVLRRAGAVAAGLGAGLAVVWLVQSTGAILVEPLGPTVVFAGIGLVEGVSRAAGAPFFLVPLALSARWAKDQYEEQPTL